MMTEEQIFKKGSTTYYWSSKFFPEATRQDVFKLYSFVRVADDFVDATPQDKKSFDALARAWSKLASGKKIRQKQGNTINKVTQNMYDVAIKYHFDFAWIDAFLASMKMDLQGRTYETMDDTLEYIYGSAEVIGLMMARILGVKPEAYEYAKMQGRAMQYINFIRDISEDIDLGRCYFPKTELHKYGLETLSERVVLHHRPEFREFIEGQLQHYTEWQKEANKGFKAIPYKQRIALRTAVDMYNWTALKLARDPFVVFYKKVKPSKYRVVTRALKRSIHA